MKLYNSAVTAGAVIMVSDLDANALVFTPAANANGLGYAHLTFRVQDDGGTANGGVDTDLTAKTLTFNVTPVNDAPKAVGDEYPTDEDTPLTITVPGILSNDSDVENDPLTAILVTGPDHGTLTLAANGSFIYSPSLNFNGADSFTYKVNDGQTDSNVATVQITVTPVNDAPVMTLLNRIEVQEGQRLELQALAHDVDVGDVLSYSLDTAPAGATIDRASGLITWKALDGNADVGFSVRATDKAGVFALASFSVHVNNVAPLLTLTGDDHAFTGEIVTLALSHSDPGDDTISAWILDWGDGVIDTIAGDPSQASHVYHGINGSVQILAQARDEDGLYALNPFPLEVLATPLQVKQLAYDGNGFAVRFNDAFDPAVINLYDSALTGLGGADVTLVGAASGAVKGSLVFDANNQGFCFIKTGGGLVADRYTLTLRSDANAFHNQSGNLDGNGNYVPGDDFVYQFNIAQPGTVKLSLPDFLRGPGQDINVPAPANQGIPLQLTSAGDVHTLTFVLNYNPDLLHISGINKGKDFPGNAILTTSLSQPGHLTVQVEANTVLPGGVLTLLNLVADVPATAPYFARQILDIASVQINGIAVTGADDDALHVVGYLGDVNGSQKLEKDDVTLIQRVALRTDSGFAAWNDIDPLMVADIDNNRFISSLDATRVYQELVNNDRPEIPPIPDDATLNSMKLKLSETANGAKQANTVPQIDLGNWSWSEQLNSEDKANKKNWRKKFVTNLDNNQTNADFFQTFRVTTRALSKQPLQPRRFE